MSWKIAERICGLLAIALLPMFSLTLAAGRDAPKRLYTEVSEPGESMDSLVVRAAPALASLTAGKGREVCGAIVRDGDGYRLEVRSIGRGHACEVAIRPSETAAIFHTHAEYMSGRFSPEDYGYRGYMIRGSRWVCWQDGPGTEARVSKSGRRNGNACAAQ